MLVLGRKVGEEIIVPAVDLVIRVLEVRGNSVRLGCDAPACVRIFRSRAAAAAAAVEATAVVEATPADQPAADA